MTTTTSEFSTIATRLNDLLDAPLHLFIDGRFVEGRGGSRDIVDPTNGDVFATTTLASPADVDDAVIAAHRARKPWTALSTGERAKRLHRLGGLIEMHAEEIARLEARNLGKSTESVRSFDIAHSVDAAVANAGWATRLSGETRDLTRGGQWHAMTLRQPIGVVGAIVPWNAPFPMAVNKATAALAAGCTVVLKPSELTPISALCLGILAIEAGIPAGALNVVPGLGHVAGAALVEHPRIAKVAFTGSTRVGREIAQTCGRTMKRYSLELGGKSPVLVFPDANLERAVPAVAMGIFGNSGQVCAAGSRLFVHDDIHDEFVERIAAFGDELRVGSGDDAQLGPLISEAQKERVLGYIESGLEEGATLMSGGDLEGPGYFVRPTVMTEATAEMRMVRDEIFGPVLAVQRFSDDTDLEELLERANDTEYGLSAAVWTSDISRALKLARGIESGVVRINGNVGLDPAIPFGGVKSSGVGRENGIEGVEQYTELKTVVIDLDA